MFHMKSKYFKVRVRFVSYAFLSLILLLMLGGCTGLQRWFSPHQIIMITPAIPLQSVKQQGEVFFEATYSVQYEGGKVVLSSKPGGCGPVWVDDAISLEVTHPDGTSTAAPIDFSFGCQGWISELPPRDVTNLFIPGVNRVTIKLYDICGVNLGSSSLYLTVEEGSVQQISKVF